MEMGLIPGVAITVVRKAPFGDPVQYRVRGSVISMRAVEAASVLVCRDDECPENGDVASEKRSLQMALAAG